MEWCERPTGVSFTVTVNNGASCTTTATASVSVTCQALSGITITPNPSTLSANSTTNLAVTGTGIGTSTTYLWNASSGGFTSNVNNPTTWTSSSNLGGATISVTVSNGVGCSATATTSMSVTCQDISNVAITPGVGAIQPNGVVTLAATATGTTANTSYSWNASSGSFSSNSANPSTFTAGNMVGGVSFTVTISNGGSCTNTATSSITVTCLSPGVVSITPNPSTVGSLVPVNLAATVQNSNANTSYAWNASAGTFSSNTANPTTWNGVNGPTGVSFTVTINNGASCTTTATASVSVTATSCIPLSNPSVTVNPSSIATGGTVNLTANATGATNPGTSYSWNSSAGLFASNIANPVAFTAPNSPQAVLFTVTISNGGTCTVITTASVTVTACVSIVGLVANASSVSVVGGSPINLSANSVSGLSGATTYLWNGSAFSSTLQNPSGVITPTTPGAYVYTVTANNGGSCTATASIRICVRPNPIAGNDGPVCVGGTIHLNATGGFTYSWTGPPNNSFSSNNQSPQLNNATTGMAGIYTVTVAGLGGCTQTATTQVVVNTPPSVILTAPAVCAGQPLIISATVVAGSSSSFTYQWRGAPDGTFTSTTLVPSLTRNNSTISMSGYYTVTVIDGNGCTATNTVTATVHALPSVTLTAPIVCEPQPLVISSTVSLGSSPLITSYNWSGPAAFNTTTASPTLTRNPSLPGMSGIYTITIVDGNSCTATASVDALVKPFPYATLTVTTPICEKETIALNLTVNPTSPGALSFSWSGPQNYTSTLQSPSILNALPSMSGNYSVTINLNGCTNSLSTSVRVKRLPNSNTRANSPICQGSSLSLSSGDGDSYSWAGPSSEVPQFTSTLASPTRINAQPSMSGIYSETVTLEGCTVSSTVNVLVKPSTTVSASTTVSVCSGQSFTLSATASAGSTYNWSGPNGFSSNQQNPVVTNAQVTMGGTYTVTANLNGCTATATTSILVKQTPFPSASGGGVCAGQLLQLTGSFADSYAWAGPGGYTSTEQNPVRNPATSNMGGAYTYSVTIQGCTAQTVVQVNIKARPAVGAQISKNVVCSGASFTLLGSSDPGNLQYTWVGPNQYYTVAQNPIVTNANTNMSGVYQVVAAYDGCNNTATVSVTVLPPITGVSASGTNICVGGNIQLTATGGESYSWAGPNGFISGVPNPLITNANVLFGGAYTVTVMAPNSCTASTSTNITVYEKGAIGVTSNSPLCIGSNLLLNATGGTSYSWSGPNGFSSTQQSPIKSNVIADDAGVYFVTAQMPAPNLCTNSNSILVQINNQGATAISNSPVCTGQTLSLNASVGASSYSWAGPGGFSSTQSNPQRNNASPDMSGVYSVTVQGGTGCTGTNTVSVEVRPVPTLSLSTSNGENNAICTGGTVQLLATTNANSYSWRGPNNFAAAVANPIVQIATTMTGGIYSITVSATNGCTATATIIVAVKPCYGSIGDLVWKDLNKNGIQDAGEPGVGGITVELYQTDAAGTPTGAAISSKNTDVNGNYKFEDVPTGMYKVKFVIPSNMDMPMTLKDQGEDDTKDSDVDPATGFSQKITIDANGTGINRDNPTIDLGLIQNYGSLGNFVWKDLDKDGIQDTGEPGVPGVTVELYKAAPDGSPLGVAQASRVTDNTGFYEFTQLVSGDYVVKFIVPSTMNMPFTLRKQGNDAGLDSNPDPTTGLSEKVTINANETGVNKDNPTIDAGLINPILGSIGDYVWKDLNKNGLQDSGEPGVAGVSVELYKTDANGTVVGAAIASQVTDGNGGYRFTDLSKGDYKVKFIVPVNMNMPFTSSDQGNDDSKDSDAQPSGNPKEAFSPKVTLNPDGSGPLDKDNLTIDAGLVIPPTGSIGDYVWKDLNRNGVQDQGEVGVSGITVELYKTDANGNLLGSAIASQTTNTNGGYSFTGLDSGDYKVKFIVPTTMDMPFTSADQGNDDSKDSDAQPSGNPKEAFSPKVTLNLAGTGPLDKDNPTIDAGLVNPLLGSIGDFVWKDLNLNGLQDPGEPGVGGVTVELYKTDINGNVISGVIASKTTDANGYYLFDKLSDDNYKVKFIVPPTMAPMAFSPKDQGGDDVKDSDVDPTTGFSPRITISVNSTEPYKRDNPTIDAGLLPSSLGSLGDYVWKDKNKNGQQDSDEAGVPGVTVELYKLDAQGNLGSPAGSKVTDATGRYLFDQLLNGVYRVKFIVPANMDMVLTQANQGPDDKDSDADPTSGLSQPVTINVQGTGLDKDNPTIDAGLIQSVGSIGDFVWKDLNSNGLQDQGEPVLQNITVELYQVDPVNGFPQGGPIATKLTDAKGNYLFDNLPSGSYKVKFYVPVHMNMGFSKPAQGTDPAKDSDPGNDGFSPIVKINTNATGIEKDNLTIDAGIINLKLGSISNFVWKDLNQNGIQDAGEPGVPGVTVQLYNGTQTQLLSTLVTDDKGFYIFDLLPSNSYAVKFSNLPVGCIFTKREQGKDAAKDSDPDPTTGITRVIDIDVERAVEDTLRNNPNIDAGLISPFGSIGDYVWKDKNANGVQDADEVGVPGVTVELYRSDANGNLQGAALKTTTTDANGKYSFEQLDNGNYRVKFVVPANMSMGLSPKDQGADDAKDSDADPTTGLSPVIPIDGAATGLLKNNPTIDAGLINQYGSIGDYVWLDVNMNGKQDVGESPIKMIKVQLYNSTATVQLAETMTDDNGKYLFDQLSSGTYRVKFVIPADAEFTASNMGDDTKDSDPNAAGLTHIITIDVSKAVADTLRNNPHIDAGVVLKYGSIGDYVWKDVNQNGVQDANEKGVSNIKVALIDGNTGQKIDEITTDNNGFYKFDHLLSGKYRVQFSNIPTDCDYTKPNQGGNDAKDSDVNGNGLSHVVMIDVTLSPGDTMRNNPNVDAGLIPRYGSIGDYVWFDKDNDGIQEANEPAIPNFKVELYNADTKQLLRTQLTNQNGKYLFDSLVTGKYQVRFVLPSDWLPWNPITQRYQGNDPTIDSNAEPFTAGWSEVVMIETIYPKGDIRRDNPTIDAGVDPFGSVGDFVWYDNNQNGIQDQGEPGVPGVKVVLLNANKTIELAKTVTDNTGRYRFDSLIDGRYYVKFILPNGTSWTTLNVGANDSVDSDANDEGCSDPIDIVLTTNFLDLRRNNYTVDAGIIPCVKPSYTATAVAATCNGLNPNADAQLLVQGFQNGWKYDVVAGSSYTGNKTFASATTIPVNGVIASGLANPATTQDYTIRVWTPEGCYTDKTVTLTRKDCGCADPKCIPFLIKKTK
ncbi:MAG: SdrD B-like domain-containing protein [Spirosomataceae bacterium]